MTGYTFIIITAIVMIIYAIISMKFNGECARAQSVSMIIAIIHPFPSNVFL